MAAPKGHPKWGGKRKGSKHQSTLTKEAIRDRVQARVAAELDPILDAQIALCRGVKYLVLRSKSTGRFLRKYQLGESINPETEVIEVWEKEPSTPAFTDLMNRAADKPAEQVQKLEISGEVNLVSRLHAARQRTRELHG